MMKPLEKEGVKMTKDEWHAAGVRRFGKEMLFWKFVCPMCETVIEVRDYKKAGAPESAVGMACIGRYIKSSQRAFDCDRKGKITKGEGCDYASWGLFNMNPIEVECDGKIVKVFNFYSHKESPGWFNIVTVYRNPSDFPNEFVARKWSLVSEQTEPKAGEVVCRSKNYEDIEKFLSENTTLVKTARHANDDNCIVETWI